MASIPDVILSSGHQMPLIGMGTAAYSFPGAEVFKSAVLSAIKLGYRHLDTASLYETEKLIGEAVAEALALGLIKSRYELFITSKLWISDGHPDRVLPALQLSLQNLQTEYLDLYLIHWPVSMTPGEVRMPGPNDKFLPFDYKNVWAAMEECQCRGLAKSIGVSNFTCKKLGLLLDLANIPPSVNQVEVNPLWQQENLIKFCKAKGIVVTAYSPLGTGGQNEGKHSVNVMESELLKEIAKDKGKTTAQVCLRLIFEQGVGMVVKSFTEARLKQNLEIFDWELSEEEHMKIKQLLQCKAYPGHDFVSADGPYKSEEELWDGEI